MSKPQGNLTKIEAPLAPKTETKGYISPKRMKDGEEFRGIFRKTFTKKEIDKKTGKESTKTVHYFTATKAGTIRKIDKFGEASLIPYAAGDSIGVNGSVLMDRDMGLVKPGTPLVIFKKGTQANSNGVGETQLMEVYRDGDVDADSSTPTAASSSAPVASNNDDF